VNPIIMIPARMDSTRLPGKPLAEIAGKPMILHVLARGREADVGPVVVACAEQAVVDVVHAAGGIAVLTDPALPSGSDRIAAALHVIDAEGRYDAVINLQGDLPTIAPADVRAVLHALMAADADIATLVAPIESEAEADSPSIVKAACAFAGGQTIAPALYFSRNRVPSGPGPLWHHVGIYAYRRAALTRFVGLAESPLEQREKLEQLRALEAGMRIACARIAKAPFGVDTAEDLDRARRLLQTVAA
jgi:3-deoxy-manno-octulosonate cytidylyltransferase (CMP-KDO synthetase)